jgi:hypothetical protein
MEAVYQTPWSKTSRHNIHSLCAHFKDRLSVKYRGPRRLDLTYTRAVHTSKTNTAMDAGRAYLHLYLTINWGISVCVRVSVCVCVCVCVRLCVSTFLNVSSPNLVGTFYGSWHVTWAICLCTQRACACVHTLIFKRILSKFAGNILRLTISGKDYVLFIFTNRARVRD